MPNLGRDDSEDRRPLLLTIDEAAASLAVSRRFVQTLIYEGVIGSVKIGRARRVPTQDLDAYVEALRDESGADRRPLSVIGGRIAR